MTQSYDEARDQQCRRCKGETVIPRRKLEAGETLRETSDPLYVICPACRGDGVVGRLRMERIAVGMAATSGSQGIAGSLVMRAGDFASGLAAFLIVAAMTPLAVLALLKLIGGGP